MNEIAQALPATRNPTWLWAHRQWALSALIFVLFIGLWEGGVRLFDVPSLVLPPPSAVLKSLAASLSSGQLTRHIWATGLEVIGGFALGGGFGFLLGCLIGRFPILEQTIYPYVVAFQTVPKVALAPLIVIWFGFGLSSKIVTAATICFFPVIANTLVGLRVTPADQVEMMAAFTASRSQIFWKARLPHALPYIFAGLDIGVVLSVIGAIVGEFVGAQAGLGYMILQRQFTMDIAGVFAILVILSIFGMALHALMRWLQRKVVFWIHEDDDRIVGA
ncbi:ABC transporter permease [Methylocapsa sp. S129]|uniref:ABC transporter permease n=1 Tax=Methylocapsa sp. S129 TaxID=1641869 RepID=UPI00131E9ED6|nr:ABC transporter permease [Methylocapsa sp. S129]